MVAYAAKGGTQIKNKERERQYRADKLKEKLHMGSYVIPPPEC